MSEAQVEEAGTTPAEAHTRGQSLLDTRNRKMGELFSGKHYKIQKEVHLEQGQVFKTPFGHKGRHGFVLVEVDESGSQVEPKNTFIVGASVLKFAHEEYQAIYGGLPENFGKSARQLKAEEKAAETPSAEAEREESELADAATA